MVLGRIYTSKTLKGLMSETIKPHSSLSRTYLFSPLGVTNLCLNIVTKSKKRRNNVIQAPCTGWYGPVKVGTQCWTLHF